MSVNKKQIIVIAAVGGLMCLTAWSWRQLNRAASNATVAAETLAHCQQLTVEIENLRGLSPITSAAELTTAEVTRMLEMAAEKTGIDPSLITSVRHSPSERVGSIVDAGRNGSMISSTALVSGTVAELDAITTRELVTLISALTASNKAPRISSLAMTASSDEVIEEFDGISEDLWNAKVTLTSNADSSTSTSNTLANL